MVEEIQGPQTGLLIDHPTGITGLSDLPTGLILLTGREVGLTLTGSRYSNRSLKRVSFDMGPCYVCGRTDHNAKNCPDNYINRKGSRQEN